MKTLVKISVCVLFLSGSVRSQSVDPNLATRLQQAIDSLRIANGLPGLTAALILPDGSIWKGASILGTNDLIGVASNTKTMMAALTMKLVEEGTLRLDDSLYKFLPKMTNIDSTITIRQLLGMRAGIRDFESFPNFWSGVIASATTRMTTSEILSYVGTPLFAPGTEYEYVNTNYLLMHMIIESKTGRQIQDLFHEKLWNPLGLSRTYYYGRDSLVPPKAPGHHKNSFWEARMTSHFDRIFTTFTGSGNVFSTMEDLARFVRALNGTQTVLSTASMREMTLYYPLGATRYPEYADPYLGYGLGTMFLCFGGYASIGHDGGLGGYLSQSYHFPALGITLALAYNYQDDNVPRLLRLYSAFLDVYVKWAHAPILPPKRSLIVAGGIRDSGAVYKVDTLTFSHRLIGRNYSAEVAGVDQASDGKLLAFTSDLTGWHLNEWNGATANGPIVAQYNVAITDFTYRPDSSFYSYYGSLYRLSMLTGQSSFVKTLFPGTSGTITGIAAVSGGSELWLSVNKGGAERDLIYRMNPTTGDTVFIGSAGLGVQLNDIAFNPDGILYGVTADSLAKLVRISQSNGQATVVGTLNLKDARCLTFTGDLGTGVERISDVVPTMFALSQNYPNPFNPRTTIRYQLPVSSRVTLRVYDVLGREVAKLVNDEQRAGVYEADWSAPVSSGVYFYRLEAVGIDGKSFVETKKMMLVH